MALHPKVAKAADALIAEVTAAAAHEVETHGVTIGEALRRQWDRAAEEVPFDWAMAVLRLRETGDAVMLGYADPPVQDETIH